MARLISRHFSQSKSSNTDSGFSESNDNKFPNRDLAWLLDLPELHLLNLVNFDLPPSFFHSTHHHIINNFFHLQLSSSFYLTLICFASSLLGFIFLVRFFFHQPNIQPLFNVLAIMRYALPALAAAAAVNAQGVTEYIAPKAPAPSGCQPNYDGKFAIQAVPINQNNKRQLSTSTTTSTLFQTTTIPGSVVTVTVHTKPTLTSTETDVITSYTTTTPTTTIGTTSVVPISQIPDGYVWT